MVVDDAISEISSVNWEDDNVVTRIFKGAGYITAKRNMWSYGNYSWSYIYYTARPLAWGNYDVTFQYNTYNYKNSRVLINLTSSCMNFGGVYWTSDASQKVFSMVFNNSTGLTLGYGLSTFDQAVGANIRCVKDE